MNLKYGNKNKYYVLLITGTWGIKFYAKLMQVVPGESRKKWQSNMKIFLRQFLTKLSK
jgi:hypothetical protein